MGKTIEARAEESGSSATGALGKWRESRGARHGRERFGYTRRWFGFEGTGTSRRGYEYQSEDDDDSSEDDSEEDDESSEDELEIDWDQLSPMEREEALVQTALARIRRAQEKGRADVKLNKEEMAALERHKKRMAKEARKQERRRRKEKGQRYSIPLSQLQAPVRRRSPTAITDDDLPLHPSPGTFDAVQNRGAMPPVGYFPPPNASRTRHRSSTSSSQRPPSGGDRGSSPFQYAYVGSRQASDNMSPASSTSSKSKSKAAVDPFQFQTEGSSAQGIVARRNVSGSTDGRRTPAVPATSRVTRSRAPPPESESSSDSSSEESTEESTSDGTGNGAQIVQPPPPPQTRRGRREAIVVEEAASREPARESSRGKKSSNPSPSKRKPVASRKKKK